LKRFRVDWNEKNEGRDDHLVAFASMGVFCNEIAEKLLANRLEHMIDFVFADSAEGIDEGCDWLDMTGGFLSIKTCWMKETTPGEAVELIFW